jgi:tetratricopeptide (TPR) repeat protein
MKPDDVPTLEALSDNLLRQGRQGISSGDRDAALAYLRESGQAARRVLEAHPDRPWAHLNLGASLMEQNRLKDSPDPELINQAMKEYEEALALWRPGGGDSLDVDYTEALVNRCDALIQMGALDLALRSCREVADLDRDNPINQYNLAGLYALLGREEEAFEALEQDFRLGDRDFEFLRTDAWFVSLHDDPRFTSLIERMKKAATD